MDDKKSATEQKYLGVQEIADMLGASWNFVRENIVPEVTHIKIGKRVFVHKEAFQQYLKRLERGA
jgi:hypothetical protein